MNKNSLIIKVPGKLMIAGEYAVLESGYPAVVAAVNRYITIEVSRSNSYMLSFSASELPDVNWWIDDNGSLAGLVGEEYSFITEAIITAIRFLREKGTVIVPFHLQIQSELNDQVTGMKYGLGSSAAIVVGVISAILCIHGEEIITEPLRLYKLACIAHFKNQRNGSCADIAASVYGGWIRYSRYNLEWLINKLYHQNEPVSNLVSVPWPNLLIERIIPPRDIILVAGWTKHAAKTAPMVDKIEAFQKEQAKLYEEFLKQSKASVEEFIMSCDAKYGMGVLNAVHANRAALQYLGEITGVDIETEEIRYLCNIADKYGRGKPSGAGGGDCGIAFLQGDDELEGLKQEWEQAGIMPLDIKVSEQGVYTLNSMATPT